MANEPKGDEERRDEAVDLVVETVDALLSERGRGRERSGARWSSRRSNVAIPGSTRPITAFARSLPCSKRQRSVGDLALDRDEKSGGYIVRLTVADD